MGEVSLARERKRRRARRLAATSTVALLLLGTGGYAAACALAPLPKPQVEVIPEVTRSFAADPAAAQAVVDAQPGPAAFGWAGDEEVWANDDAVRPIASISKVVTVLVCLEQAPLEPGVDGPVHVWSVADAARTARFQADDGIVYPVPVGTEATTRQMLTLALLPSANDWAEAYAVATFGSVDAFAAAANDWAARNGLASLHLEEPTGMSERNVATASDLVRLGRIAATNPTLTQFTSMASAELPWGIGTVRNTNALLRTMPDVIGLKTGRTVTAGYNLLTAATGTAAPGTPAERELLRIAVVLGRESEEARAADNATILVGAGQLPQTHELVAQGEPVGTAVTVDGVEVPLVAGGGTSVTLLPGEQAEVRPELARISGADAKEGAEVGSLAISLPGGTEEIPVITTKRIVEPDFWWRVTNPGKLFG